MPPVRQASIPIVDESGYVQGTVTVTILPRAVSSAEVPALLDRGSDADADSSLPPIQLLEGEEYRYEISLRSGVQAVDTDKPEVFEPDSENGTPGRLRPRLYTGTLAVSIAADGRPVGNATFEVRSRKLDYLTDFRWMLRDIADGMTEVLMERFAPAVQRFAIDESADAATLYQRFAFLRSLILDDSLDAAIHHIVARPHVAWEQEEEQRSPGQGVRASSDLARQMASSSQRVPCPPHLKLPMASLPKVLISMRTETTLDNPPNRFVRFALTRWRDVVLEIKEGLALSPQVFAVKRGLQEVEVVLDHLDAVLGEELFREVGDLTSFPLGNQVLQKREGYRDVLRAYLQFELAASLAWEGGDDVYRAGQRDVATLYEYWTFVQLAKIVARLCGVRFDFASLIEVGDHGLGVGLRRGRTTAVGGTAWRLGRRLRLELAFNRTFPAPAESWSTNMRPDCSLEICSDEPDGAAFDPVWLHFDAKYRIEALVEVFGDQPRDDQRGEAKRSDLLKMHAYRDAIKRSAGAYVLYPGSEPRRFKEYHELLPGLGAFGFRPTDSGTPFGADALDRFLNDVLEHVAAQITQHERGRYWSRRVYEPAAPTAVRVPAATFLRRPPADTRVLLGYVRGPRHLEWIHRTRLYNLRATGARGRVGLTGPELGADLLILYGRAMERVEFWRVRGAPELHTKEEMDRTGYPRPSGKAYYCLPLQPVDPGVWQGRITPAAVLDLRRQLSPAAPHGWPVATTWLRVVEGTGNVSVAR